MLMKKYKKWLRQAICAIKGHDVVWVTEQRYHGGQRWRMSRKGGKKRNKGRWVLGAYKQCERCGKKLSNFERIWY